MGSGSVRGVCVDDGSMWGVSVDSVNVRGVWLNLM